MSQEELSEINLYRILAMLDLELNGLEIASRRLVEGTEDERDRWWLDGRTFLDSLWRLRGVAKALCSDPRIDGEIGRALNKFDLAAPALRGSRDTLAHLDEYVRGGGDNDLIGQDNVRIAQFDGTTIEWFGCSICVVEALTASRQLKRSATKAVLPLLPSVVYQSATTEIVQLETGVRTVLRVGPETLTNDTGTNALRRLLLRSAGSKSTEKPSAT